MNTHNVEDTLGLIRQLENQIDNFEHLTAEFKKSYQEAIDYLRTLEGLWHLPFQKNDIPTMKGIVYKIARISIASTIVHLECKMQNMDVRNHKEYRSLEYAIVRLREYFPNALISFKKKKEELENEEVFYDFDLDLFDVTSTYDIVGQVFNRCISENARSMEKIVTQYIEAVNNPGTIKSVFDHR